MTVKVAVYPRDPNPYQESLYAEMHADGFAIRYVGEATHSRTANLLLLPVELALLRVDGYRIFHLHWTFGLVFPLPRFRWQARRVSRLWFGCLLLVLRRLGYRVVWTAHNVLPHDPVFDDDVVARRTLVSACDLVIAHNEAALRALADIGASPDRSAVIPIGPPALAGLERLPPALGRSPRTVGFVGRVAAYKGVADLADALRDLDVARSVVIAGPCDDPALREELRRRAVELEGRLDLDLRFLPDADLVRLIGRCDAIVFPFREVTTSSSVALGLAAGRAVVIPALDALEEVPASAAVRYAPGNAGLRGALRTVAEMPLDELRGLGSNGRMFAEERTWTTVARRTETVFRELLAG